ncbi:MAG: 7-carboxy-7-deazaguanine synthase [Thermoplasmata archaeon]|jgi:7-carboxy-7-deazaguanine synthase|nr:7-carboxy-7-deazaguanine synthase [Thermoplasmata archaeon]
MQVTEVFSSIQGEGRRMGLPTTFVRTTGCHLRCVWCDAAYAFHGGSKRSVEDLVADVAARPTREVCFTGGEPLLQKDAWEFVERLLADGYGVLIETSGNIPFARANELPAEHRERLCVSMDVKCPGSGMADKNDLALLADLRAPDQLKFVIADKADFDFSVKVVRENAPFPCPVFFNPVGGTDVKALAEWVLAEPGLPVQVGLQLHKLVWGDVPGR